MSHSDRPYLTRPLAGVDQALGEGRARPPVELLDRLRERLDRLDQNHPSASRRPDAVDEGKPTEPGVATEPGDGAESQDSQRGDGAPAGQEGRDQLRQNRIDARGGGEGSDGPGADQPAESRADGSPMNGSPMDGPPMNGPPMDGSGTNGEFRTANVVRADKGERYRPWFATNEPANPWFVE